MNDDKLWRGVAEDARRSLGTRDYKGAAFSTRLSGEGVEAGRLAGIDREGAGLGDVWIPGVEIFARTIYPQRHRGFFGEFVRQDEGILARIGLWPRQWSAARMFAGTAKGFHLHPPAIDDGEAAAEVFRRFFVQEPENYALRRYDREQWDVMFFVQGIAEMILRDVREGLPRRTMRFFVDGDDRRSQNNVGVIIPAGVAHAIRVEGSEDLIMVYGTTTTFRPEFEGRIASDVESATLPESWQKFLDA